MPGFPPPEWYEVTWRGSRQSLHSQIRVLRYLNRGQGPVVQFQGQRVHVHQTSLTPDEGTRIECADGPLWVTWTPGGSG
jgi:methionyl-tRNA formyltransferase